MLDSKQWHNSLHRDFQNCYSTRRSLTGFFSSNSSSNSTRVPFHPHTTYTCTISLQYIQRILHPESNSTCRRQRALRVLLHTEGKGPSFQKRNSMHRRQGDLLEIHPCSTGHSSLFSLSRHSSHSWPSSLSRQFCNVPVSPGNPPHSSILRLECIFYKSYSSIGFHRNSTEYQLGNYKHFYKHYILQRKGDVAISVKLTHSPE